MTSDLNPDESTSRADWRYWFVIDPPFFTSGKPLGLVRHRPGTPEIEAQELRRDGAWHRSNLLLVLSTGRDDRELATATREEAVASVRRAVTAGTMKAVPEDLSDDGTPE